MARKSVTKQNNETMEVVFTSLILKDLNLKTDTCLLRMRNRNRIGIESMIFIHVYHV